MPGVSGPLQTSGGEAAASCAARVAGSEKLAAEHPFLHRMVIWSTGGKRVTGGSE